jgi:hypothetical protein
MAGQTARTVSVGTLGRSTISWSITSVKHIPDDELARMPAPGDQLRLAPGVLDRLVRSLRLYSTGW